MRVGERPGALEPDPLRGLQSALGRERAAARLRAGRVPREPRLAGPHQRRPVALRLLVGRDACRADDGLAAADARRATIIAAAAISTIDIESVAVVAEFES